MKLPILLQKNPCDKCLVKSTCITNNIINKPCKHRQRWEGRLHFITIPFFCVIIVLPLVLMVSLFKLLGINIGSDDIYDYY